MVPSDERSARIEAEIIELTELLEHARDKLRAADEQFTFTKELYARAKHTVATLEARIEAIRQGQLNLEDQGYGETEAGG